MLFGHATAKEAREVRIGADLSAEARRAKAEGVIRRLGRLRWRVTASPTTRPTGCQTKVRRADMISLNGAKSRTPTALGEAVGQMQDPQPNPKDLLLRTLKSKIRSINSRLVQSTTFLTRRAHQPRNRQHQRPFDQQREQCLGMDTRTLR